MEMDRVVTTVGLGRKGKNEGEACSARRSTPALPSPRLVSTHPCTSFLMPMPSVTASATNEAAGIHRSPMAEFAIKPAAPFIVVLNVILARPGTSDRSDFQHALTKVHHRMLLAMDAKKMGNAWLEAKAGRRVGDRPRAPTSHSPSLPPPPPVAYLRLCMKLVTMVCPTM